MSKTIFLESKDSSRFLQTIQKWPSGGRVVRGGRPDLHHISLTAGLRVIDKTRDQDEFSGMGLRPIEEKNL